MLNLWCSQKDKAINAHSIKYHQTKKSLIYFPFIKHGPYYINFQIISKPNILKLIKTTYIIYINYWLQLCTYHQNEQIGNFYSFIEIEPLISITIVYSTMRYINKFLCDQWMSDYWLLFFENDLRKDFFLFQYIKCQFHFMNYTVYFIWSMNVTRISLSLTDLPTFDPQCVR